MTNSKTSNPSGNDFRVAAPALLPTRQIRQGSKSWQRFCFHALLMLALFTISIRVANAQNPQQPAGNPAPQQNQPQGATANQGAANSPATSEQKKDEGKKELQVEEVTPDPVGLGDDMRLKVANLTDATEVDKLILFLDGIPIKGIHPTRTSLDSLTFSLSRNDDNKDAWGHFLAKPKDEIRETEAKVGLEDQAPNGKGKKFKLKIYNKTRFEFAFIGFVLAILVFLYLSWKTNIIRDSSPPELPTGKNRPFSLARTQVAWWFFIVFGSFLLIRIVTDSYNTINQTGLVLIGIGTAAALSAAVIDNSKNDSTQSELLTLKPKQATLQVSIADLKTQVANFEAKKNATPPTITAPELETLSALRRDLAGKEAELELVNKQVGDAASNLSKPVSEGFIKDILSDVNGISFHRFQMVIWTITLGIIFLKTVYNELTMPEFNDTMLGLMGISAGTYVAFKIPERQTDPEPQQGADGNAAGANAAAAAAANPAPGGDNAAAANNNAAAGANAGNNAAAGAAANNAAGAGNAPGGENAAAGAPGNAADAAGAGNAADAAGAGDAADAAGEGNGGDAAGNAEEGEAGQ